MNTPLLIGLAAALFGAIASRDLLRAMKAQRQPARVPVRVRAPSGRERG